MAGLMASYKYVFAILHYTKNEQILGHGKTCTSKKQRLKLKVHVYRKSKKVHPPNKIGNVSFKKPQPKYQYKKIPRCLAEKGLVLIFDYVMIQMYAFVKNTGKNLQKATKGTASVLQFLPTHFPSTSVTTPMPSCRPTVWDIV